jgi:hypothetical protein
LASAECGPFDPYKETNHKIYAKEYANIKLLQIEEEKFYEINESFKLDIDFALNMEYENYRGIENNFNYEANEKFQGCENIQFQSFSFEQHDENLKKEFLRNYSELSEIPVYGSEEYEFRTIAVLSTNGVPKLNLRGWRVSIECEDITNDGKPELFIDINTEGGMRSRIQYIFASDEFNVLLDTAESGVSWWDSGLSHYMEDLDGDGVKEYNGWWNYWDLVNVCSACRVPPRKIMCLNGKSYIDCTKKFPELLQKDLNESLEKLRSPSDYLKNNIDAFYTELIFFIATSINLDRKEESLDYIKNNFSKETFDWVEENWDIVQEELAPSGSFLKTFLIRIKQILLWVGINK